MEKERVFSVEDGVAVQQEHLKRWKVVLNDKAFIHLCGVCNEKNAIPMRDGYDVLRGQELDSIVYNYGSAVINGREVS